MNTLRIGLAQIPHTADITTNLKKAIAFMEKAASQLQT